MEDCCTEVEEIRRERFEEYRQRKLFTDVTLIAENSRGEEEKFHLHRAILAAVSPYVTY